MRSRWMWLCFCGLVAAGCGRETQGGLCADAAAHAQACFPDQTIDPGAPCDEAAARTVLALSCEELAAGVDKADNPLCTPWTWWLCGSGSSGRRVEVAVEACLGEYCQGVTGLSCARVKLEDSSGHKVAEAYSNENGRVTFDGLERGTYVVKVLTREGDVATMETSEYSHATGPASQEAKLESGDDEVWAYINLVAGSDRAVQACSGLEVAFTAVGPNDEVLDREQAERNWIIKLTKSTTPDQVIDYNRPMYFYDENGGQNRSVFRYLRVGTFALTFVRVELPSSLELRNVTFDEYERYVRLYGTGDTVKKSVTVHEADLPDDISLDVRITDPLAP